MKMIDIEKLNRDLMISDNDTEAAVLSYLWDVVQNVPVEDYLKEADKDENVSTTLAYLRLYCFVPFFIRASDIVWDYDGDRTYSFIDDLKEKVVADDFIKPYTLNVIKNCLQKQGLTELSDFDLSPEEDEDFYNNEKWDYFCQLSYCFDIRDYLKSVGINALTILFSNITDSDDAQKLANRIYAFQNQPESGSSESSSSEDSCSEYIEEAGSSISLETIDQYEEGRDEPFLNGMSNDDPDFDEESDDPDDEDEDEEYEHEFASQDEFVEFLVEHADELIPLSPTFTQCHLYEFLNGDCD